MCVFAQMRRARRGLVIDWHELCDSTVWLCTCLLLFHTQRFSSSVAFTCACDRSCASCPKINWPQCFNVKLKSRSCLMPRIMHFSLWWNEIKTLSVAAEVWRRLLLRGFMYFWKQVLDMAREIGIVSGCIRFPLHYICMLTWSVINHRWCALFHFEWHCRDVCDPFPPVSLCLPTQTHTYTYSPLTCCTCVHRNYIIMQRQGHKWNQTQTLL